MPEGGPVWLARPRGTAQVTLEDGRTFEGPIGTPLGAYMGEAYPDTGRSIVAAVVDGELEELTYAVRADVRVAPVDTSSMDGLRIYQRSLIFLLVVAAQELFPTAHLMVDHSVTLGGFFCQVDGRPLFDEQELEALVAHMRAIVARDEPITRELMPVAQAKELFAAQGYDDKARLLEYRAEPEIPVYSLCGVRDYFYGYMVPSTGRLTGFALELYPPGIILRVLQRLAPLPLHSHRDYPKLMAVFREYGRWLNILGVEDMGALNAAVESGRVQEAILVSEALHERQISDIAETIVGERAGGRARVVLIAGPSSSGKTTFARRLGIQLKAGGRRPFALGLDDYFVERERTPRDERGEYDFEALEAMDLVAFNRDLAALLAGQEVALPHFDFKQGRGFPGQAMRLPEDTILLIEGIHGLNPALVTSLAPEMLLRVYVSALTQLNLDHHNRVPTTDVRLLRRIVRDAATRGYSAQDTIRRWPSVRRGEERNIFPFQENADMMFNSALAYELAVLKPFAEPLLLRVPHGSREVLEARRLLAFLRWVRPCSPEGVPSNSLLREFVGGSILENYAL